MDCIKCRGTGWCADEVLGVQEQWMCERCNGSGEEPYLDWQEEMDAKMHAMIYLADPFLKNGAVIVPLGGFIPRKLYRTVAEMNI